MSLERSGNRNLIFSAESSCINYSDPIQLPLCRAVGLQCRRGVGRWADPGSSAAALPPLQLQSVPYDERPLPASRKQPAVALEPEKSDSDVSEAPRGGAAGEPEPLTEKALREAGPAVDVLGESLVGRVPRAGVRHGEEAGREAPSALSVILLAPFWS